ncbi:hypothetical protein N8590_00690 [bacterium]|nr:hypothetical protein [Planctomicrobium sp.]MDA7503369.1 hypothetical protein [bacterium]MDA7527480.1 hypothetical protein [bacterium]
MSSSGSNLHHQYALRIERGRTQHPERPICEDRFLIGAGSNCHLQLGGEMPILHSVVIQTDDGLWIDSVVQLPQLLVNRQQVRDCQIFAGDLIEIGDFVFSVQGSEITQEAVEVDLHEEDEDVDLRELNAEDLVDLMAEEMEVLDNITEARQTGANALLESVQNGQVTQNIQNDDLQNRELELDRREAALADKADHLQRAQERLEEYLRKLTAHVNSDSNTDGDNPFRKTA